MSRNNGFYQDLGAGPDNQLTPSGDTFGTIIDEFGNPTSVNDLPTVNSAVVSQDFLIIYVPGLGHRKILINDIGQFMPAGGTTGQALFKLSANDYDYSWQDLPAAGGVVDHNNRVTLNGEIIGFGDFDVNGDVTVTTTLNLPNIVLLDGGNAASTYAPNANGPYGVWQLPAGGTTGQVIGKFSDTDQDFGWIDAGTGSAVEVQEDGTQITTGVIKLNFTGPGVAVTEDAPDELTITITGGGGETMSQYENEYFAGYLFSYIDTTSFSVTNYDVTRLYRPGRRIKFTDGANTYFGTVTSSAYSLGNTTINMAMEGGAVLTNTITDFALFVGAAAWTEIAESPFGTESINSISSGIIGATVYWVIVGDAGNVAYSTNAGITWTSVVTNITDRVKSVCFNADNETFYCITEPGGLYTFDGTTWAEITIVTPPSVTDGDGSFLHITYHNSANLFYITYKRSAASPGWAYSSDNGLNWTYKESCTDQPVFGDEAGVNIYYCTNSRPYYLSGTSDATSSPLNITPGGITSFLAVTRFGVLRVVAGGAGGAITAENSSYTDDVTFGYPSRALAYSPLHDRFISVGDNGEIGSLEGASMYSADSWQLVQNGFNPLSDITDVEWSEADGIFIAVNNVGQICRSSNGVT